MEISPDIAIGKKKENKVLQSDFKHIFCTCERRKKDLFSKFLNKCSQN